MFSLTHTFLSVYWSATTLHACIRSGAPLLVLVVITPPTPASDFLALPPLLSSLGPFHPLNFTCTSLPLAATEEGSKSAVPQGVCLAVYLSALAVFGFCPSRSGVVSGRCLCLCVPAVCTRVCV